MTLKDWEYTEALTPGQVVLIEASAGTGKTWQIAGLVVRMVAEYAIPIDRILVITFTNAATVELRDRVRRRLELARKALAAQTAPSNDHPIIKYLWEDVDARVQRRGRVAAALMAFDQAPISTIHGFSQRMLDQLAFESGQEPGLELMTDASVLKGQLIDDALATVYADANMDEVRLVEDMGFDRKGLKRVADAMTKAVCPTLEPSLERPLTPLAAARAWVQTTGELCQWLDGPEGQACIAALEAELQLTPKKGKRLKGIGMTLLRTHLPKVREWLSGPALRAAWCKSNAPLKTPIKNFRLAQLERVWTASTDVQTFAAYPLFAKIDALIEQQDALWCQPLLSFASTVRATLEAELQRRGQLTYSTMLSRLAERIAAERHDEAEDGPLALAIRERFDVALVDEFQDTDGAQWSVMQAVFGHPDRRLMMIGDPKQAIYSFRGADVHVYMDAAGAADVRATMRTNFRSDAAYVGAMNHLWREGSGAFDMPQLDYVAVGHNSKERVRIRNLPVQGDRPRRALELRWVDGFACDLDQPVIGQKPAGERLCAEYAAQEVARLLHDANEPVEIWRTQQGCEEASWNRLRPQDIAVLVRTNDQARQVCRNLHALGLPAVSAGRSSVLESPALTWLCAWLDAVAEPARDQTARILATTPLFGWTASQLAEVVASADGAETTTSMALPGEWDAWVQCIHDWSAAWPKRGFVRVIESALDEKRVMERVLSAQDGERHMTDLRHLIELGHAEERRTRLGPSGLASWFRSTRAEGASKDADDAKAQRLESDADAVQVVTIHKSKGLEYPVVLVPFAWSGGGSGRTSSPVAWHTSGPSGSELCLNFELPSSDGYKRAKAAHDLEGRQEQTRLLYVALTRARHHTVVWLGPMGSDAVDTSGYAFGRIALRARDADGVPLPDPQLPSFKTTGMSADVKQEALTDARTLVIERLDRLQTTSEQTVGWSPEARLEGHPPVPLTHEGAGVLQAMPWDARESLVTWWRVCSYSKLVEGRTFDDEEPQRLIDASLDEEDGAWDDASAQVALGEPGAAPEGVDGPLPTADLRGGTETGTWVHAVFENLCFATGCALDGRDLVTLAADLGMRHGVRDATQHELLAETLPGMLDTPLDGGQSRLPVGYTLRQLPTNARLDELRFDMRLGAGRRFQRATSDSGDEATTHRRVNVDGVRLALRSRADTGWRGQNWLAAVVEPRGTEKSVVIPGFAGILKGFIDLVMRVPAAVPGGYRYYLADYKTNRIGPRNRKRESRLRHYSQPWMAWEMAHHGYHLQALLYTVAVHRMLCRRPEYDYDTHIGGHLYLFLRGMIGAHVPRPGGVALGVYHDRWPASVVLGLDAALLGESTEAVQAIIEKHGGVL